MLSLMRPLWPALGLSLLLHGAPFLSAAPASPVPPSAAPPLKATLATPPTPATPSALPLSLPEPPTKAERAPPERNKKRTHSTVDRVHTPKTWSEHIRQQFSDQQAQGLYYPEAARRQGIEGEVLVLLLVDESGAVAAARVEASSGHTLLDDAALRAVRQLRSLPADTPRDMLLPVSFRLR